MIQPGAFSPNYGFTMPLRNKRAKRITTMAALVADRVKPKITVETTEAAVTAKQAKAEREIDALKDASGF